MDDECDRMLAQMRPWWLAALLLTLLLLWRPLVADPLPVKVGVLGPQAAVAALQKNWKEKTHAWVAPQAAQLLIAIGEKAFRQARELKLPVLALRVSPAVVREALQQGCECSSVWLHPDPALQLQLAQRILSSPSRIAVVYQEDTTWLPVYLRKHQPAHMVLRFYAVSDVDDLEQQLAQFLGQVDALVLFPDAELFNARSARFILLTSYRLQRPVIGPNRAFVKAGSLASLYTTAAAVVAGLQKQLDYFRRHQRLPVPLSPQPSIAINKHVAHSFGLATEQVKQWFETTQQGGHRHEAR